MSAPNLTRRSFVKSALVTGIGVSFTISIGCGRNDTLNTGADNVDDSEIELLSWVTIHSDNTVTLRVPQTEIGQGVSTTIPQMLAEELELDWKTVKSEFYDPAHHKANNDVYVWTATLGSLSAHYLFEPTQIAGAQIRTMLIDAAAQRLGVSANELTAKENYIVHDPSGQKLRYADVAESASTLTPPDPAFLTLKQASDRRFIGKSIARNDLEDVVRGAASYGIDLELPGMRFAAIKQCPTFGGRLEKIGSDGLVGMPGNPETLHVKAAHVGYNSPVPEGEDPDLWAAPVRMDDAVAVIADSWWQAKSALDSLDIDWNEGPHQDFSSEGLYASLVEQTRTSLPVSAEYGDVTSALENATQRLSAEYHYPFMDPAPLEPMNCTALLDSDEVHVWTNSQFADDAWRIAYEVAGVAPNSAHLHLLPAGGGFGRRLQNDFVHQAVQIAKQKPGVPIKLIWTREETTQRSFYAPLTVARFEGGLDESGDVTAWRCAVASGMSAEQSYGAVQFPFRPANARFEYMRNQDTPVPFGWMRGVGFTQHLWMNFGFLDELRELSGKDAIAYYRSLLNPNRIPAEDENYELAVERVKANARVLEFAAANGNWNAPKPSGAGRGIAVSDSNYYPGYSSSAKAAIVDVSLDQDNQPEIEKVYIAIDAGTVVNPDIVHAQLEGGVAYALTTALMSEITIENGRVMQSNFHDYPMLKLDRMPKVEIAIIPSDMTPLSIGEDAVPITIAALVNAIADAGGPRIRRLPIEAALN